MRQITVKVDARDCALVLAPAGMTTSYDAVLSLDVTGGRIERVLRDPDLDLCACLIRPSENTVELTYCIGQAPSGSSYPEAAFVPRQNRFTSAASELAAASKRIVADAGGGFAGIEALVAEAESRFVYDHPETRFTDGSDEVPYLSCGTTPGSCVDINTYLMAILRAAGYEAAYFYGYFFPQEKGGAAQDGHCWVATLFEGKVLEWDIAHHIKAGLGATKPGLNPRPGQRVGISHSMGHRYLGPDGPLLKILGEPVGLNDALEPVNAPLVIRMSPFS